MKVEHVDDIPVLYSKLKESGLGEVLNKHFQVHGNWGGVTIGQTVEAWLVFILSCGEHRLCRVEDWASERLQVLRGAMGTKDLSPSHLSDDRLGSVLDHLSATTEWELFESELNRRLLQVYRLPESGGTVRLDATLAQSFREAEGLFQEGYSKQRRADLAQIKVMLSTYDPLGMPLTVEVVSGNCADEPLYRPAIDRVRRTLTERGLLYVGDKKMGTLETRAYINEAGDSYLMPLALRECPEKQVHAYLAEQPSKLQFIEEKDKSGKKTPKAKLFEVSGGHECSFGSQTWAERRIVVYSVAYGQTQGRALDKRVANALHALDGLLKPRQGKKVMLDAQEVAAAVQGIHGQYRTAGLVSVEIKELRAQKVHRKYGKRPEQVGEEVAFQITATRNEEAIKEHKALFGWRVYATNAPKERLSPTQSVECYWQEYNIEHRFNELHNKTTALLPIFLHKENRIVALVRLLILAIKFSCLIQHQLRQELQNTEQSIKELYPGNPGRKTKKPTTSLILGAFKGISLVTMTLPDGTPFVQMTALKPVQLKILKLLALTPDTFEDICQFCRSG
ncbi:MAG: IS1634 family transposase [Saprospiraceae bacterium]